MSHEKDYRKKRQEVLRERQGEVLEENIWPALEEAGVPKWFWPKKSGDVLRGEWGLCKVLEVRKNAHVPMWHVTYNVVNPFTSEQSEYTVQYSSGAVAIVIVNGEHLLVTNKHRFPTGSWQKEFPQSFTYLPGPCEEQLLELQEKKFQWLVEAANQVSWEHLGDFHDDPGTQSTKTQLYIVKVEISEEKYQEALRNYHGGKKQTSRTPMQFRLMTAEKIEMEIDRGAFSALILIGAWYKALRRGKIPFAA